MLMELGALLATTFEVGPAQLLVGDALGFATGLLCVWLAAKASIWNFAWGILNSAILGVVFLNQRLFAESALQVVFIVLSLQGWVQWATGRNATAQGFKHTSLNEQASLMAVALGVSLLLWFVLVELRGNSPPMDAVITALSLCAQWQLNRRQASSWVWWIVVDLISVPLYWSRGLYLIAGLYLIFLVICIYGLHNWRHAEDRPYDASKAAPV
jgi:nicotinamide mononucleotide transporter